MHICNNCGCFSLVVISYFNLVEENFLLTLVLNNIHIIFELGLNLINYMNTDFVGLFLNFELVTIVGL